MVSIWLNGMGSPVGVIRDPSLTLRMTKVEMASLSGWGGTRSFADAQDDKVGVQHDKVGAQDDRGRGGFSVRSG